MSKIMICGLNGSGKTTLGKKLAKIINYKHLDIEKYYFSNNSSYNYDKPLSKEEVIDSLEKDFNKYDNIVFTACKGDYGNLSDKYDLCIFINLDKETRLNRIKQRSFEQFGNRILENGDLYEKENQFFKFIYQKDESDIIKWFETLKCDKIVIDGLNSIEENINIILNKL